MNEDAKKAYERLTTWDKIIGYFNPVESLVRMRARGIQHEFSIGYDESPISRSKSGGMFGHAAPENWKSNRDRLKAIWDARDLCQFDFIGGMMARIVLYTCGRLHSKSLTGDEQIDAAYDDYFHGWCGDETSDDGTTRCDLSGRHRFIKMLQMAMWGFLVDGDHAFLEVDPQLSPTGEFCLQSIEADRVGSPLESTTLENYIGGVTLDPQTGRIVSYRVFQRTRTNQYINPQEVPVDHFIHLFDSDRADEYRGRTKLLRLLTDARDIREWVESEKTTGKVQSQWAALVGLKDPFANKGATAWTDKTPDGTPTQPAQWGKIMRMAEGEIFNMLAPPSRPSGAFISFVEMIIRKMAVSLDLPYGFLWNLAALGGVTARIEVQQAQRRIEYWQELLINKVVNRVRQKVLAQGIMQQMLPPHPNWKKCEYHWGLSIQTDVGYEMEADISAMNTGIISVSDITGKYGKNPREVFLANATTFNEAVQVGDETGVPMEGFAPGLYPNGTALKASITTGPIPPPPPGSQEALGEKGVGQLLDLLKAVGDGKVDPDAAIQTMKNTFGIPEAMAKQMCPEPDLNVIQAHHPPPSGGNGNGNQPARQVKPKPKPKANAR